MLEITHSNPELKVKCWKCKDDMRATSQYSTDYSIEINLEYCGCEATAILKLDIDMSKYNYKKW